MYLPQDIPVSQHVVAKGLKPDQIRRCLSAFRRLYFADLPRFSNLQFHSLCLPWFKQAIEDPARVFGDGRIISLRRELTKASLKDYELQWHCALKPYYLAPRASPITSQALIPVRRQRHRQIKQFHRSSSSAHSYSPDLATLSIRSTFLAINRSSPRLKYSLSGLPSST
jgi:hypothetical protein